MILKTKFLLLFLWFYFNSVLFSSQIYFKLHRKKHFLEGFLMGVWVGKEFFSSNKNKQADPHPHPHPQP